MTKEALKLALEALENIKNDPFKFDLKNGIDKAITAIKEALAQPEQDGKCKYCTDGCPACDARKLPPQRTWVGLTDEDFYGQSELQVMAMKYAEAKLKEKNHG
jgi:hypothetical protein